MLEIALTNMQDLALCLDGLHEVGIGPLLKPVQVPLDGTPSFCRANCTTQFGDVSRVAEGVLYLIIHATDRR